MIAQSEIWKTIIENKDREISFLYKKYFQIFRDLQISKDELESEIIFRTFKRFKNYRKEDSNLKTFFNRSAKYSTLDFLRKIINDNERDRKLFKILEKIEKNDI